MSGVSRPASDPPAPGSAGPLEALERRVAELEARVAELEGSGDALRETINRLGEALTDTHDRGAMVAAVLDTAVHHLRARAGVLYQLVAGRDVLRPTASCGDTGGGGLGGLGELMVGEGLAGHAARTGSEVLWPGDDAELAAPGASEPAHSEPAAGPRTAMAVPVRVGGRPYGVLALYGRSVGRPFAPGDVQSLEALVHQVEPAIENTFLYEEAQRLAITDGLTSLWNRRHFDLRAAAELQRANRFREPFSIVLIDVDSFKDVNDRFGHQAGDAVLIDLAVRFTNAVRDVDVVARFGGDEFGLILPSTDTEGARFVAQKIRASVAEVPFSVPGAELAITVSAGVAMWPDHGTTLAELLSAADRALYGAKRAGRDGVGCAGDSPDAGAGPDGGRAPAGGNARARGGT